MIEAALRFGSRRARVAADGETRVAGDYGSMTIVLPIGSYVMKAAGGSMEVAIVEGHVTEFCRGSRWQRASVDDNLEHSAATWRR